MDDQKTAIWADTLFLYIFAKRPIEGIRGKDWLNEELYFKTARMISRFMILELELPLPKDLDHNLDDSFSTSAPRGPFQITHRAPIS